MEKEIPENPYPINSWQDFVLELEQNILPIYQAHESKFDRSGIHDRMHICRAVIFSEVMGQIYHAAGVPVDFYGVCTAIAFHDSGREANGKDYWEEQSAENCYRYLVGKSAYSKNPASARTVANWILKDGEFDLGHSIVYDADVLEIMRPCCGHDGLEGFNRHYLRFASRRDPWAEHLENRRVLRDGLIQEVWQFIQETEKLKDRLSNSSNYMGSLLEHLAKQKSQYQLLAQIID